MPKMLCHVPVILIQNDLIMFNSEMYRVVLKRSLTAVKCHSYHGFNAVIFRVIIQVKVRCDMWFNSELGLTPESDGPLIPDPKVSHCGFKV